MKHSNFRMQQVVASIFFVLFSLTSCKKGDTVPTPTTTQTGITNNIIADVPEKTIDAKGGTLTLGTLVVDIPQNAISTSTKITLTKVTDKPFGTSQKSDIYYLNNLPDVIDQPIVLSLSGFTANDKITTYLAESTFVPSLNKEMINYRPVTNNFVNGKLQVSLEANTNNKSLDLKAGTNPIALGILAVSGRSTYTSVQGHFRVTFLASVVNDAMDVAQYLEEAYSKFNTTPISMSYANRTVWPVEVSLSTLDNSMYGYMSTSVWGNNSAYMCFNDTKLADKAELRITVGHEFMHFVQNLYDSRNRFSKAKFASAQLWIDEATAVWAESMFTSTANYISTVRAGNEMSPYSALLQVADAGASTYGYGMSSMIKYLVSTSGNDIVKKIYEQIQLGQKPAEAIRLATAKSYYEWYGYFIDNCTRGQIYSDIPISGLVGNKADGITIATVSDSVKQYDAQYGQLQSRIYITNLTESAFTDGSSLNYLIKSPNTELITVYKFNSTTIEKIGQDLKYVTIPDIKNIAKAGFKIMTVVTNQKYDYTTNANQSISLIARVKAPIPFRFFSLEFSGFNLNYTRTIVKDNAPYSTDSGQDAYPYWLQVLLVPCIQNGNVINANYNGIYDNVAHKGTATFTLNADNSVSYTITDEMQDGLYPVGIDLRTTSASGKVPFSSPINDKYYGLQYFTNKSSSTAVQTYSWKRVYNSSPNVVVTYISTAMIPTSNFSFSIKLYY